MTPQPQDATGQTISPYDLVMFQTTAGDGARRHDRGLAVRAPPTAGGERLISMLLADGTEAAKAARDVTVADRSFLFPGTTVAPASDPGGQIGVITGVATALDLAKLDVEGGEPRVVATGVSTAEVRPVNELSLGDYVVSGTWLGRVVEVSVDVDVLFDDGSACRVTNGAGDKLRVVRGMVRGSHDKKNAFYPGDRVAGDASVFNASRWLRGHWKPSRTEGTVATVETGGVLVYWVVSLNAAVSAPPPAYQPNPRSLTFFCAGGSDLMWFWSVSRLCFFRHDRDPNNNNKKEKKKKKRRNGMKQRRRRAEFGVKKWPMVVANTRTTVDVLWQDGKRQRGVPSASIVRTLVRSEQDFFPGQRVVGKTLSPPVDAGDDSNIATDARVGVVKSHSYKDQTVCVSWNTSSATTPEEEVVDTVMSTYDLARSSDHKFFYGDMVVRLHPAVKEETAALVQKSNRATNDNDLSWVGHIVDLCDAQYIDVKWGDGTTSKVLLHEVAFVKQRSLYEIHQEMGDWVHDEDDHDASDDKPNEEDTIDGGSDAQDALIGGGTAIIGKVGNIIKAVIRTLSGMLLAPGKMYMLSRSSTASASIAEPAVMTENVQACSPTISDDGDCPAEEAAAAQALASHDTGDNVFNFKHFDVVQSPHDHHYLDNKEQECGGERKWLKRVQEEWKILDTSLPDTIYVRAYENRMDLLRAVMVGASGTPYHDGLFFFDLQLPPSYPTTPPLVNYHSFGLRVNPNLYPSGTVCLSLLNTFGGKDTELWSPESSSLLQVVISIQGLVLVAQPYYNQAGYIAQIGTPEGRRNEMPYCENTYLVNLHTMLHLIRRPPAGFEEFVRNHFCRRGRHVLKACEAYLQEGCPVGTLDGESLSMEVSKDWSCSMGFKLALASIVPRLVESFSGIGAKV
ncbi:unnamed protein product [Urochloa decumbens]|uniref:UBC core domain-containing protein n=1 Tax=Urochloa decumbens TaxID=240449 RepID=A0ABC8VJJ9_9POAL